MCFRKLVTLGWKCAWRAFLLFSIATVSEIWHFLLFMKQHPTLPFVLKMLGSLALPYCTCSANHHFKVAAMLYFEGTAIVLLKHCVTLSRSLLRRLVSLSRTNVRFPVVVWGRWQKLKKRRKHKSSSAKHWETSFLSFETCTGNVLPQSFWYLKFY